MFDPEIVVVPVPACVTDPVPEIALLTVIASLRLKARAASSVTLPEPKEPLVPPLPIRSVPAVIVVAPVYVFVPLNVSAKVPAFVSPTLPPKAALIVASALVVIVPVPTSDNEPAPGPIVYPVPLKVIELTVINNELTVTRDVPLVWNMASLPFTQSPGAAVPGVALFAQFRLAPPPLVLQLPFPAFKPVALLVSHHCVAAPAEIGRSRANATRSAVAAQLALRREKWRRQKLICGTGTE